MGRATVELLLERGARVALIDWNEKEAQAAARSNQLQAYAADVSNETQVQAAFAAIDRDFGHPRPFLERGCGARRGPHP